MLGQVRQALLAGAWQPVKAWGHHEQQHDDECCTTLRNGVLILGTFTSRAWISSLAWQRLVSQSG